MVLLCDYKLALAWDHKSVNRSFEPMADMERKVGAHLSIFAENKLLKWKLWKFYKSLPSPF